MLLLFSHRLTEAQMRDARESFGIDEFVYIPDEIKGKWNSIPPDIESLLDYCRVFFEWIDKNGVKGDYVLVQGDFGATYIMVNYCFDKELVPIYATTRRESVEIKIGDRVETKRVFEHVLFRKYERR